MSEPRIYDHFPDCKIKCAPVDECGCLRRHLDDAERALSYVVREVAPHIKRGRRFADKDPDGGKCSRFVDITLPKHVADKILGIHKQCKELGL